MKDINKVILLGRLGADPVKRTTKSGTAVAHFSVATSRRYLQEGDSSSGEQTVQEWIEETQWHRIVTWGKQAEACALYLKKGDPVYVDGQFRSHQYDSSGVQKTSFEVHADQVSFLAPHRNSQAQPPQVEFVLEQA